jgi:hypothetical protein
MSKEPRTLTTTREVMAALGGIKAVASLTGRKYSAVSMWTVGSDPQFPSNSFVVMNAALAAIGKSAPPSLWGMKIPETAS